MASLEIYVMLTARIAVSATTVRACAHVSRVPGEIIAERYPTPAVTVFSGIEPRSRPNTTLEISSYMYVCIFSNVVASTILLEISQQKTVNLHKKIFFNTFFCRSNNFNV